MGFYFSTIFNKIVRQSLFHQLPDSNTNAFSTRNPLKVFQTKTKTKTVSETKTIFAIKLDTVGIVSLTPNNLLSFVRTKSFSNNSSCD